MHFNEHWDLEGKHSFLSPSSYHWVNYTDEKLIQVYSNHKASVLGTRLHNLAKECIELGILLPRSHKTLNMYVNDAIRFEMKPEQPLYYSRNCFGTADAISFRHGKLRIHDLKTGVTPASMMQLFIYTAIFCLEYDVSPSEMEMELRIYQLDDIIVEQPEADDIVPVMDKIIYFNRIIEEFEEEGLYA